MKGKTRLGINLKIASATSVVVFTLLVAFIGTYTWFQAVKGAHNGADNMIIEKTEGSVTGYSIHEYYGITDDESTWGFNPTPTTSIVFGDDQGSSSPLSMGEYSLDNPDHPVLVLFSVEGSFQTIIAKTSSVYLASSDATLEQSGNPLSSVIETQSLTFTNDPKNNGKQTGNLIDENGSTVSRTYMPIVKNSLSSKSSFVTFVGNTPRYEQQTKFFEGDITGKSYIGIVLNYNSESLNYIFSYYLGHTYLTNGLQFSCDWSLEV